MGNIYKSEVGKREVLEQYRKILASWPVENHQYEVETRFGPTFVIESGSKGSPPLILLHGSVSNSFTWYGDVASLSKTHHVYAIDIIGEAGLSAASRPGYKSGAYALWLNETIHALKLSSCSIVAMSLGSWMALSFATTYPEKVDHLVLLCPGGLAREKASFLWKAIFFSLLGKWGQLQTLKLVGAGHISSSSLSGLGEDPPFASLVFKYFRPRTAKMPLFSDQSLHQLTMPILMLFGDSDQLLPASKSMNRLKPFAQQAEIELLPDTGHLIVNQADRILKFLNLQRS
ncbi:alpha/beta hydrolase [Paenibacillus sp. UMB4589-SE434]|uniref:alpha/beta fold hydrolase n=1 Tax=Paenibacillus sp. UMB4589-SE434 TaxID=3046314 RepID=UPI00254D49C7|nr:alpha/beta hydrolase [Paenibacillus sp. UMB4589-SE434]MDK8183350.1 alpha/beta hydrolase [Paenibacillus sp. UMB4589-SE434]